MITREQVADLREGDVVSAVDGKGENAVTITGRLRSIKGHNGLALGGYMVRMNTGEPSLWCSELTVVSRAPRPLYVNHDRTEARAHDVVRDGAGVIRHYGPVSDSTDPTWWAWEVESGFRWTWTSTPPQPLILLVDGVTGQVVP